jgi:dipeptidyl aminopeptidase/acylaminoacyl peptidase
LGAAWSPDGKRIAFLDVDGRWGVAGLETVDVASGVVTRLQPSLAQPGKPTWSADGRYVAVGLSRAFSASFREGRNQIWVVPSDGKGAPFWRDADPIASLDTRGWGGPVWSPDGQKLAAIQDGLLKIWPVAGMPRGWARRAYIRDFLLSDMERGFAGILYQAADKLKIVDVGSGAIRECAARLHLSPRYPRTRIVIHAGHLVDAVHDATQVNKDIVIEGNRIMAVVDHDPSCTAAPIR